jgi:hypothetical protein
MYAILNCIMNIAARASTLSEIGTAGGLTIANCLGVSEANAEIKLLAGYLSMSIPFICIAIVKGVETFVHLAGQMRPFTHEVQHCHTFRSSRSVFGKFLLRKYQHGESATG